MNPLHYPDIERCKKLTALTEASEDNKFGTYHQYYQFRDHPETLRLVEHLGPIDPKEDFVAWCPSIMEMLDVIPNDLGTGKLNDVLKIQNSFNDWSVSMGKSFHTEGTLPNAVADLILWLVENGYLKF